MDDEIDRLVIGVRPDTGAFLKDVDTMRAGLEGTLTGGADRAGRSIEATLLRAATTGKLGFDDLRKVALAAMADIASAAVKSGLGLSGSGGGATAGLATLLGGVLGLPGRATGGPVSPGRAYVVGERGPELFVPTSSGSIATTGGNTTRPVQVAISIAAPAGTESAALRQSSRQVARAVKAALAEAG